jgi:hypothetical protein
MPTCQEIYELTDIERSAIVAGLTLLHSAMKARGGSVPLEVRPHATDGGTHDAMTMPEVEALIAEIDG